MNRLWGTRCYEIGPIDRADDCGTVVERFINGK